ncbi:MAG: retropepsin-like domain-containing protein [Deltaproteobacteria bacterium]|nr:retropepsin-like domain-containing protein [Deltaproteobacteria bacterium]
MKRRSLRAAVLLVLAASSSTLPQRATRQRIRSAFGGNAVVASEPELDVELFGAKVTLRDTPALDHPDTPLQLGAQFLEPFVVQLDYPNGRMRLLPRSALDLRKHANVKMRAAEGSCRRGPRQDLGRDMTGNSGDFTREAFSSSAPTSETPCLPTVQVTFPGNEKTWLLLDTGAAGPIVVSRSLAKREGWLDASRKSTTESHDVFGKRAQLELLVLTSVKLGGFELADVPVAVPAEGERLLSGQENWGRVTTGSHVTRGARASGRLGYDALRHFVVTIDFDRELMQIAQPAKEAAP